MGIPGFSPPAVKGKFFTEYLNFRYNFAFQVKKASEDLMVVLVYSDWKVNGESGELQ